MFLSMRRPTSACWVCLGLITVISCGGRPPPPKRGVVEKDLGSWLFRRYQKVLDIEVYVAKNPGVGYTASYVRKAAEKSGHLEEHDIVNAVVVRYRSNVGILRSLIVFARRLAQESGYTVEERRLGGVRVIQVKGHGESWALWPAPRHVVKVGGRAVTSIPSSLVEQYAERYPSKLPAGALEGPLPPRAPQPRDKHPEDDKYDPDSPSPDWDKYHPKQLPKGDKTKKK